MLSRVPEQWVRGVEPFRGVSGRNGLKRPVLKHGPRSLTCMRVFGWQALMRNESERVRPLAAGITDRS